MRRTTVLLTIIGCLFLVIGCVLMFWAYMQPPVKTHAALSAAPFSVAPLVTPNPETPPPEMAVAAATAQPLPLLSIGTLPPTPEPDPEPEHFWFSFAGDCTLGSEHGSYGASGTFVDVVGSNYAYPFAAVLPYLEQDDMTLINFEGTLTGSQDASDKLFRFRAPAEYAKILTEGSVECVSLANNHTRDFGQAGYEDTKAALTAENIPYVEHETTMLYETSRGLKVGIFAAYSATTQNALQRGISRLKDQGAQVIVCVFHMGDEGSYRPTDRQVSTAHMAVDCGADIVVEHHPHVLQPMEVYQGKVIFYSLGNFSFGGNRNPADKDTVLIQQEIILDPDGTVTLGQTVPIPCSVSGHSGYNDYQPTPYDVEDAGYQRVLSKLDGTFTGPDLVVNYNRTSAPSQPDGTTLPDVLG